MLRVTKQGSSFIQTKSEKYSEKGLILQADSVLTGKTGNTNEPADTLELPYVIIFPGWVESGYYWLKIYAKNAFDELARAADGNCDPRGPEKLSCVELPGFPPKNGTPKFVICRAIRTSFIYHVLSVF